MLADAEDVARFQREMRIASRMQHPNIMTMFTTGSDNGVPLMVMEYLSATGTLIGTLPYMAPEQWLGGPAAFSNDIWAVGCVLYELLSGRPGTLLRDCDGIRRGRRPPRASGAVARRRARVACRRGHHDAPARPGSAAHVRPMRPVARRASGLPAPGVVTDASPPVEHAAAVATPAAGARRTARLERICQAGPGWSSDGQQHFRRLPRRSSPAAGRHRTATSHLQPADNYRWPIPAPVPDRGRGDRTGRYRRDHRMEAPGQRPPAASRIGIGTARVGDPAGGGTVL